jgi:type II secretory pathway pseudopilin PulG
MQRISQLGFTLFEITFVIVITLLLLTIIVMGQDFTINSQVNRLERDFRIIQTAIYDAQNVVSSNHGDARKVSLHLQGSDISSNNNDSNASFIDNWNSTSGEAFEVWQKARPADFAKGLTDTSLKALVSLKLPGGVIGVSQTQNEFIEGLKGNYAICANNITGRLAKRLDFVMDDGNTASGSMKVSSSIGGTAIVTDSIVDKSTYMVCQGVL